MLIPTLLVFKLEIFLILALQVFQGLKVATVKLESFKQLVQIRCRFALSLFFLCKQFLLALQAVLKFGCTLDGVYQILRAGCDIDNLGLLQPAQPCQIKCRCLELLSCMLHLCSTLIVGTDCVHPILEERRQMEELRALQIRLLGQVERPARLFPFIKPQLICSLGLLMGLLGLSSALILFFHALQFGHPCKHVPKQARKTCDIEGFESEGA